MKFTPKRSLDALPGNLSQVKSTLYSDYRKLIKQINRLRIFLASGSIFFIGLLMVFAPQYKFITNKELANTLSYIGASFIISACASFLFDIALRRSFFKEISTELAHNFSEYFENADRINRSGIECVYEDFPDKIIEHGFSTAKKQILIIQTWFSNIASIERAITTAFSNSTECKAEIYLLKPDTDLARRRSVESNLATEDSLTHSVEQAEELLHDLAVKNHYNDDTANERLRCFRYDSTPTISIFKCDDKIFWGPYFKERRTWNTPWFELTTEETRLREVIEIYIKHIQTHAERHIPTKQRPHAILPPQTISKHFTA